ncbi:PilZ domain-containing protein [Clostridium rectalis]|uniref:PilZ domain-containing protein n=1 Tax=Clostridium rectalis TaxID=2040295 RepID=UPI0013DDD15F|nr:PilZ domain-containing protein [Clostridium rectalis]
MTSNIYKNGQYVYKVIEKRYGKRAKFDLDIYYPRINDKSIYKVYKSSDPIMKGINISSTGILLLSKAFAKVGDFISFSMKIGDRPSFWCMAEVKWVSESNSYYLLGCEFFSLTMGQINIIKEYVKNNK